MDWRSVWVGVLFTAVAVRAEAQGRHKERTAQSPRPFELIARVGMGVGTCDEMCQALGPGWDIGAAVLYRPGHWALGASVDETRLSFETSTGSHESASLMTLAFAMARFYPLGPVDGVPFDPFGEIGVALVKADTSAPGGCGGYCGGPGFDFGFGTDFYVSPWFRAGVVVATTIVLGNAPTQGDLITAVPQPELPQITSVTKAGVAITFLP